MELFYWVCLLFGDKGRPICLTLTNTLTKEILIQLDWTCYMNYTIYILSYTGISTFVKKDNIYIIYSFTLSNILTSFAEPDAPGSCLVHTGPAFHASASPQSQNPPPVELCICKKCVIRSRNMCIKSKRKTEMCIVWVIHKYKSLHTKYKSHCITNQLATTFFSYFFFR